jgi:antitoxin component of MazEF toxin-antitoxin module
MTTAIRQWGNSFGVRIPRKVLEEANLKLDDDLEITTVKGGIFLQNPKRKTFSDIAEPLIDTKGWKFCREEANAR